MKNKAIEKADSLESYMIALNTQRLINIQKLVFKIGKTLDSGNQINPDDIKALEVLENSFLSKIKIDSHECLMSIENGEYRKIKEAQQLVKEEAETLGYFILHLLEDSTHNIESYKRDELGKENLSESELEQINTALIGFRKEESKNIEPDTTDKRKIFDSVNEAWENAKDCLIPSCEQIELFRSFGELFYETWDAVEENKSLDHETEFINRIELN